MAKRNGFGVYPGARISAQQVTLIAVSVLALILMITTLVAFDKVSDANETQNAQYDKLITRFESEINAVQLMVDNQKNESGDARISTLNDIIKHVYAADALSVYKVEAFGGDELISTDTYSRLTELISQSIHQLQSGNRPDDLISEFTAALNQLRGAGA